MPRDDEREDEESAAAQPAASHDATMRRTAEPPPKAARKPLHAATSPELAAYRSRLDEQLNARREMLSGQLPEKVDAPPRHQPSEAPVSLLRKVTGALGAKWAWLVVPPFSACLIAVAAVGWLYRDPAPSAELQRALQQERDRSERLTRDMAQAWRQLTLQATALADRAALEQEARDLRDALQQTEEASGSLEQKLAEERERRHKLEEQLAQRRGASAVDKAAQGEIARLRQTLKQAQDDQAAQADALAQERERSRTLEGQLAQLRDASAAHKAAQGEIAGLQQTLKQAQDDRTTQAQALAQERERIRTLEEQLANQRDAHQREIEELRQALKAAEEHTAERQASATSGKPIAEGPPDDTVTAKQPAPAAVAEPADDADLPRLMLRARALLGQGHIGAARSVLERAAESGSGPALFALAETFDPAVLAAWGTLGTQGDLARARELYTRALAGGVLEARERLAASRQ